MKICPVCGKEFERHGNNQKYCSEHCRRTANRNTPNVVKHNKDLPMKNKYRAFLAYDCKCAICGWQVSEFLMADEKGLLFGYGNKLHHIDLVSDDGIAEDGNLILLCPNCHEKAHTRQITKDELRKHTRPLEITTDELNKRLNSIPQAVYDWCFGEKSDANVARFIKAMELASLLKRAGYITLNTIWSGWIYEIEQGVLDAYHERK